MKKGIRRQNIKKKIIKKKKAIKKPLKEERKIEIEITWRNPKGPSWLTKYEKAKIIGIRAKQLSEGAPPLIKVPSNVSDPIKIAELELEAGKLPFLIKREIKGRAEILELEKLIKNKEKIWETA